MSAAARAYAFARVCGARGTILRRDELFAVRGTTEEQLSMHAAAALGIDSEAKRFARLLRRYRLVLRVYREHGDLIRAFLRVHEIENLKLAWRAIARDAEPETWVPLWRDFGDLATIPRLRGVTSLHDLVDLLKRTPYGTIAAEVFAAHDGDLASSELAFDRWASAEVVRLANALPHREALAREIALRIVRKRDAELRSRGVTTYGLSEAAVDAAITVHERPPRRIADPFAGQAFRLAPALALIELAEGEYARATAVVERGGDAQLDDAADARMGSG